MHGCLGKPHGQLSLPETPVHKCRTPLRPPRRRPRASLATSTPCATQPWPCWVPPACHHRQWAPSRSSILTASSSTGTGSSSSSGGGDSSGQEQQQQQQYEVHPALTQQQQQQQQSMLNDAAAAAAAASTSPATLKPPSRSPTPTAAAAAAAAALPPLSPTPPPPPPSAAAAANDAQQSSQTPHHHKRRLPRPPSPEQVLQMFPPAARPPPVLAAFLAGGALLSGLLLNWAAGTPMRRSNPYTMHITFQHASKIGEGTPVRMKGVQIGAVASVAINPSHIDVTAEVLDAHNVVPVGSRVDINQFGLAADPFVDITPPEGCRVNPKVGPHHPKCQAEGLIVCDGQQIAGSQGGSMDYMMKQFLKYQDKSRVKVIVDEYRDG